MLTQPNSQKPTNRRVLSPERLKLITDLRAESENPERMTRLYDLTELGLTIEAAREIHDNEMEIEKINNLLREKKQNEAQSARRNQHDGNRAKDGNVDQAYKW